MTNRIIVDADSGIERPMWIEHVDSFIMKVLERLGIENWEISVLFCNDAFIKDLNKRFRNIDSPTDVLSFEQGDEFIDDNDITWYNAGDIVISIDSLKSNASDFSVDIDEELKRLIVHGILHLNGMDHEDNSPEQEMLQFQEHLLSGFSGIRVYGEK